MGDSPTAEADDDRVQAADARSEGVRGAGGADHKQQARSRIHAAASEARSATAEQQRLDESSDEIPWQRWGTYLSERAWGTVREDYSADGDAWNYFPYQHARSRTYRWNEDGLAGWCDRSQFLCFGLGLWNGLDDHLKERPYGLTNDQGNHGEDAKDYWFFTDNTPTHSYASVVYKYPQEPFPYQDLLETSASRGTEDPEYKLFDSLQEMWLANRYFDITVEYAKVDPEDVICRITAVNRGSEPAPLHIAAQLWFRNLWSWDNGTTVPQIERAGSGATLRHPELGQRWFYADGADLNWMFCENNTNNEKLFGTANSTRYVKDGINNAIVEGDPTGISEQSGSKAAAVLRTVIPAGGSTTLTTRFSPRPLADPFADADALVDLRKTEADQYYESWQRPTLTEDEKLVQRQAIAGLLWSKQFYNFHVTRWLKGDETMMAPPAERWQGRNSRWKHIVNEDVLLMPDAWEYPWYAAWDLAFHAVTMAMVDAPFAKKQVIYMMSSLYQHPHGEIPAYEWDFSNTNPPTLAWAAWQVYLMDAAATGTPDIGFLATAYRSLLSNLNSWLNTKDPLGKDLFAGGFLGMDNIGVFNRDHPLPTGGQLVQSDGTAWVAQYVIQLAEIALELRRFYPGYENDIEKLLLDFAIMSSALENGRDGVSLWNDDVGFYCDSIVHPDGTHNQLGVVSMQALIPLLAVISIATTHGSESGAHGLAPELVRLREKVLKHHPEFEGSVALTPGQGAGSAMLFSVVRPARLRRILEHMLSSEELLSDFGIRSLSAAYRDTPYTFWVGDEAYHLPYWPAESRNKMFGGNSNWRGPIWFPINLMLLQTLLAFDSFFGDTFTVEYPTGSGQQQRLALVAEDISQRLSRIFVRGSDGRRVVFGDNDYFQHDPHWRDLVPFYEFFDGDDGHGCGASHQTGWTATVALMMQFAGRLRLDRAGPPGEATN